MDTPDWWTRRHVAGLVGIAACVAAAVAVLTLGSPVAAPRVASNTLAPTYQIGDRVWVVRWPRFGWVPQRGDVIVFAAPPSTGDREGQGFIKRIAGLPGERVEVRDGVLFVDGQRVATGENLQNGPGIDQAPIVVPEGQLFLLGDDRGASYDSRHWGLLEVERVDGVAWSSLR
jgi:signal peptidase I